MDRIRAAEVFSEVVTQGSLAGAARTLDMSRAMVTRYLSEMEQWANVRLLHRSTRKLSLTPVGEKTLVECRKLIEHARQIAQEHDDQEPHGLIRIASSTAFADNALVIVIAEFLKLHPGMAIDFQVIAESVNLVEERIDLAIRITNQLDPALIARTLSTCRSVVCASPAYIQAHGTISHVNDLVLHNCLTHHYLGKSQWKFLHKNKVISIPVSGNFSSNENAILFKATLDGIGISIQPLFSAANAIACGRLVVLLPEYQVPDLAITATYGSRMHQLPGLRLFLDFLVEWFASHPHWERTRVTPHMGEIGV